MLLAHSCHALPDLGRYHARGLLACQRRRQNCFDVQSTGCTMTMPPTRSEVGTGCWRLRHAHNQEGSTLCMLQQGVAEG